MTNVTTLGIDLAKNVFQLHGVDKHGKLVLRKRVSRNKLFSFMQNLPPCLVGMEASGGSSYWARQFKSLGHDVRIMSPQHVKPYIGSTKNDYKDAEGICEAVGRPRMLFVPIKTKDQQDIQSIHRIRTRLIAVRTALANQIRGLLGEYGVVIPKGIHHIRNKLQDVLEDATNDLSYSIRQEMLALQDELLILDGKIKGYDAKLEHIYKTNETCQKIAHLSGIGPVSATALVATIGDAKVFDNGRQMAAWLGLTPRQNSSGEKQRLGSISKKGNSYMRYLLVHGARSVVRASAKKEDPTSNWIKNLVVRRGKNVATVAVANKNARVIWAILTGAQAYQSTSQ